MFIADINVYIKYKVTVSKIKKCYINFLQYNMNNLYMYNLNKHKSQYISYNKIDTQVGWQFTVLTHHATMSKY